MSDVWESAGLVTEVWESNTTPGVEWRVIIRDGDIGGASALADLTDVDVTSDPPAQDDVLAWDDTENKWTPATLDGGVALGETSSTAYRGDRGKTAYDHSQLSTGNPHGTTAADVGAIATSARGNSNGVASLDGDGTVPDIQLPSSIARDSEIGTQITAHDGSGTAHPDIRALIAAVPRSFHVATPIGEYVGQPSANAAGFSASNLGITVAGRLNTSPSFLTAGTYDRIGVIVDLRGTATLRLGIYAADPATGLPAALLLDAGTVSTGSTGLREVTISHVISTSGWYWMAVMTNAYTSEFNLIAVVETGGASIPGMPSTVASPGRQRQGLTQTGITPGSMPSTIAPTGAAAGTPKVFLRRSA